MGANTTRSTQSRHGSPQVASRGVGASVGLRDRLVVMIAAQEPSVSVLKNEVYRIDFVLGLPVLGRLAAVGLQWPCSGSAAASGLAPISNNSSKGISDFLLENARIPARLFQKARVYRALEASGGL